MKKEDSPCWLIKSGGRILGPHTKKEIRALLQQNAVVPIDEISEPMRRWVMIRDHQDFVQVVNDLKTEIINFKDDTMTQSAQTGGITETAGLGTDEITADVGEFQSQLKEIVLENVTESKVDRSERQNYGRFQVAGRVSETQMKSEAARSSQWLWLVTLFVFLALGAVIYLKNNKKRIADPFNLPSVELMQYAIQHFRNGDYPLAQEYFRRVADREPDRKDLALTYGLVLLNVDGQTRAARNWLGKVSEVDPRLAQQKLTALGLADLLDNEPASAKEKLALALSILPNYGPALSNMASANLMSRESNSAMKFLLEAWSSNFHEPEVLLQMVEAGLRLHREGGGRGELEQLRPRLIEALRGVGTYQQELLLAQAYVDFILGSNLDFERRFRQILDVDPKLATDHRSEPLIFKGYVSWDLFYQWCADLVGASGSSAVGIALMANCEMNKGRHLQARKLAEQAISMVPKDALFQSVYSLILSEIGLGSEASVALGRAVELDRKSEYLLPMLLQARFCGDKEDLDCAQTAFHKVLSKDQNSLAARAGLAQIYLRKGARAEAQRYVKELEERSSRYRPMLRLKSPLGAPSG